MKALTVRYEGFGQSVPLGTLADDGKAVLFEYSPEALAQGLDLSPLRLPLRLAAYPDRPGDYQALHGVPGLVCDSLPDGWGFRLMHRRMRARGLNPAAQGPGAFQPPNPGAQHPGPPSAGRATLAGEICGGR